MTKQLKSFSFIQSGAPFTHCTASQWRHGFRCHFLSNCDVHFVTLLWPLQEKKQLKSQEDLNLILKAETPEREKLREIQELGFSKIMQDMHNQSHLTWLIAFLNTTRIFLRFPKYGRCTSEVSMEVTSASSKNQSDLNLWCLNYSTTATLLPQDFTSTSIFFFCHYNSLNCIRLLELFVLKPGIEHAWFPFPQHQSRRCTHPPSCLYTTSHWSYGTSLCGHKTALHPRSCLWLAQLLCSL